MGSCCSGLGAPAGLALIYAIATRHVAQQSFLTIDIPSESEPGSPNAPLLRGWGGSRFAVSMKRGTPRMPVVTMPIQGISPRVFLPAALKYFREDSLLPPGHNEHLRGSSLAVACAPASLGMTAGKYFAA